MDGLTMEPNNINIEMSDEDCCDIAANILGKNGYLQHKMGVKNNE